MAECKARLDAVPYILINIQKWIDHSNVTAVVWANLGGQELDPALVDILYGDVYPSGRLVYTIAKTSRTMPSRISSRIHSHTPDKLYGGCIS
jgi:hypothetical protein